MPPEIEQKFEAGRIACQHADFDGSEKIFRDVIATESSSEIRNQARIYLASVFSIQYIPGIKTPENLRWLERAEQMYFDVMDSGTFTVEHADAALSGLGAIQVHRRYDRARLRGFPDVLEP